MAALPGIGADRGLQDAVESLLEKERRLTELETLLRLRGVTVAPQTNTLTHTHTHGGTQGGDGGASSQRVSGAPGQSRALISTPASIISHAHALSLALRDASYLPSLGIPVGIGSMDGMEGMDGVVGMMEMVGMKKWGMDVMDVPPQVSAASRDASAMSCVLRPHAPSLATHEIAILCDPLAAKWGLQLRDMGLDDGAADALAALPRTLVTAPALPITPDVPTGTRNQSATSARADEPAVMPAPLRMLDVAWNPELGRRGASAVCDIVRRMPTLTAVYCNGCGFGGRAGVGTVIDACIRAPLIRHFGISVDDPSPNVAAPPPAASEAAPTPARSASQGRATARVRSTERTATRVARPGTVASPPILATTSAPAGTAAHLASVIRMHGCLASLSLAGSALHRPAFCGVLTSFAPTSASTKGAPGDAVSPAVTARPATSARPTRGASTSRTGVRAAGPPAPSPAPKQARSVPPLLYLDMTATYLGAELLQDLAVAMLPTNHTEFPSAVAAMITTSNAAAQKSVRRVHQDEQAGNDSPPAALQSTPSLVGSMASLRVLNLSQCKLSTVGALPLLEVVATYCTSLNVLILRNNHLDDVFARMLAQAVRMNHARLRAPGDRLQVLDVRNNPLYLSEDGRTHPGCEALVDSLAALVDLLTLTGPEPQIESMVASWTLNHAGAAAAGFDLGAGGSTPAPSAPGGTIPQGAAVPLHSRSTVCTLGAGRQYTIDLDAVEDAAQCVLSGVMDAPMGERLLTALPPLTAAASDTGEDGARSSRAVRQTATLNMPAQLCYKAARCTVQRVSAMRARVRPASAVPWLAAAGIERRAWGTERPAIQALHPPTVGVDALLKSLIAAKTALNALNVIAAADIGPVLLTHHVTAAEQRLIAAGNSVRVDCALQYHVVVRIQTERIPAQLSALLSRAVRMVVSITSTAGGAVTVYAAAPFVNASRDRIHAKLRGAALGAAAVGAEPSAAEPDWQHAVGLNEPVITPSEDATTCLLSWPAAWLSLPLPHALVAHACGAPLRLHAQLAWDPPAAAVLADDPELAVMAHADIISSAAVHALRVELIAEGVPQSDAPSSAVSSRGATAPGDLDEDLEFSW